MRNPSPNFFFFSTAFVSVCIEGWIGHCGWRQQRHFRWRGSSCGKDSSLLSSPHFTGLDFRDCPSKIALIGAVPPRLPRKLCTSPVMSNLR